MDWKSVGAFDARFGLDDAGLGAFVRGFGVLEVGLVRHVVDLRQHHAGRHAGAEVDRIAVGILAEAHDLAVDLRADVHEFLGFDGAGGGDGTDHVAAHDLFGLEDDFIFGFAAGVTADDDPADGERAEYDDENEKFFQELFHVETAFMLCLYLNLFEAKKRQMPFWSSAGTAAGWPALPEDAESEVLFPLSSWSMFSLFGAAAGACSMSRSLNA